MPMSYPPSLLLNAQSKLKGLVIEQSTIESLIMFCFVFLKCGSFNLVFFGC